MSFFRSVLRGNIRWAGLIAILTPLVIMYIFDQLPKKYRNLWRWIAFLIYFLFIIRMTLLGRSSEAEQGYNLMPFWSYSKIHDAEYRWEILLNIFFFIPFGFLMGWTAKRNIWQTFFIVFLISASIEAAQLFFKIGFCEFDDVFHNMIGTILGYRYWRLLDWIDGKYGKDIKRYINLTKKFLLSESKKLYHIILIYIRGIKK